MVSENVDEFRTQALDYQEVIANQGNLDLILMPNEDCNFRCKYCYESFSRSFMNPEVQEGVINFVKRELKTTNAVNIDWFGGEPLTAFPIVKHLSEELMSLCRAARVPYTAGITTNGYHLTLDVFKELRNFHVLNYQVTLDGLQQTHDLTRVTIDGKGTFDTIINNLRRIRDNVKSTAFNIMLRTNFSTIILDTVDAYVDFMLKEFGDDRRFTFLWREQDDWGGDSVAFVKDTFCNARDVIQEMMKATEKNLPMGANIETGFYTAVCYAAKQNSYVIGSDGVVYKCTVGFDLEDNQVGFLAKDGTMYLDANKLAIWVTGHETDDPTCQRCFFRPSCHGAACPLYRLKTGDRGCPSAKTNIKEYVNQRQPPRGN